MTTGASGSIGFIARSAAYTDVVERRAAKPPIAKLTGFINLFNLIPVWQLDGSRGVHALTRRDRWILVAVIAAAFMVTGVGLLVIVGAVAAWRAMERETGPGDSLVLTTFVVLVGALSLLASGI